MIGSIGNREPEHITASKDRGTSFSTGWAMRVWTVFLCLLTGVTYASGQEAAKLTLTPIVELGSDDDLAMRSYSFIALQLPSGQFVIAPQFTRPQLALYEPNGKLRQLYDKAGRGPGELQRHISHLFVIRDTVLAIERNRLLSFDPDLRFIRETRLEFSPNAVAIASGTHLVMNYPLLRSGGATFASHLIDRTGAIFRSVDPVLQGPTAFFEAARVYAVSSNGGFWAARMNSSRIEYFDSLGDLRQTINIERPWFVPWSGTIRSEGFRERPRPRVIGVREMSNGMLAMITRVADANWKRQEQEPVINGSYDFSKIYDSIIEIIDPRSGTVVATGRFPDHIRFVLGSADLLASSREAPSTDIRTVIWRMQYE